MLPGEPTPGSTECSGYFERQRVLTDCGELVFHFGEMVFEPHAAQQAEWTEAGSNLSVAESTHHEGDVKS